VVVRGAADARIHAGVFAATRDYNAAIRLDAQFRRHFAQFRGLVAQR
jgi:hypothetical protein